eukprot:TRINITY_DN811_c0_g1_i4.p1 TRINITY_DN811_c0_g1~~TRINITY_DN811_c0_g1_i4.p1  ORF type:complete len:260 (-),score=-30.81 TRINITY_DN811_c0_g1_i4:1214-1993(-)
MLAVPLFYSFTRFSSGLYPKLFFLFFVKKALSLSRAFKPLFKRSRLKFFKRFHSPFFIFYRHKPIRMFSSFLRLKFLYTLLKPFSFFPFSFLFKNTLFLKLKFIKRKFFYHFPLKFLSHFSRFQLLFRSNLLPLKDFITPPKILSKKKRFKFHRPKFYKDLPFTRFKLLKLFLLPNLQKKFLCWLILFLLLKIFFIFLSNLLVLLFSLITFFLILFLKNYIKRNVLFTILSLFRNRKRSKEKINLFTNSIIINPFFVLT